VLLLDGYYVNLRFQTQKRNGFAVRKPSRDLSGFQPKRARTKAILGFRIGAGVGFEPTRPERATGSPGPNLSSEYKRKPFDWRIEIKRLFKIAKFDPLRATRLDIREYLKDFIGKPANSYANILKSLRVFYRDYLEGERLLKVLSFPRAPSMLSLFLQRKISKDFIEG